MRVDVANPPTAKDIRVSVVGDYLFTSGKNRVRVTYPNGTFLLLDFDKKVVSALDTIRKTFYQMKISDMLSYGDHLPSPLSNKFSVKSTVAFAPTVGQDSRSILGQAASPYDLNLEAFLSRQSSLGGRGGGGGFGRHRGGGGGGFPGEGSSGGDDTSFPGSPSGLGNFLASKGCKIGGELWMATSPASNFDRDQLNTAVECALLFGVPELKGLSDRIHKSNATLTGADYSVSVLDGQGNPPSTAPVVSMKATGSASAVLDPATFIIPSDYTKVDPPAQPLGS